MIMVLVVSDNVILVEHLKGEICRDEIKEIATFKFCYSAKNKNPTNLIKIGMESVDLKDIQVCNEIVNNYNIVISLHCKQIFSEEILNSLICINVHPGLNPYNRGWYPQVFSIINKKPIGVTIHLMDAMVDHGKIIDQEVIEILPADTSLTVYNRLIDLEKILISKNIYKILLGKYELFDAEIEGNYNSIKDFERLCELDLDNVATLREHIDLLRALTHGDFENAFYYECGERINVSLNISSNFMKKLK